MTEDGSESDDPAPVVDYTWRIYDLMMYPIIAKTYIFPTLDYVARKLIGNYSKSQHEYTIISKIYFDIFSECLSHFTYKEISDDCLKKEFGTIEEVLEGSKEDINLALFEEINPDLKQLISQGYTERNNKLVSRWLKNLRLVHYYFSTHSEENELLFRIQQWITSPHLKKEHWIKWWNIVKDNFISLQNLRKQFPFDICDDRLSRNFHHALKALEGTSDLTAYSTMQFTNYINDIFDLKTNGRSNEASSSDTLQKKRVVVEQKAMLLSNVNILSLLTNKTEEIDLVAKHVLFIDCDLENAYMHGINVAIIAETVVVLGNHEIDVSGLCGCFAGLIERCEHLKIPIVEECGSSKNTVLDTRISEDNTVSSIEHESVHRCYDRVGNDQTACPQIADGLDGAAGADGRQGAAGESSGNVTILSDAIWNPENLTIKLNGGDGQGGQDGGKGEDGVDGKGISREELDKLIPAYFSIYFNSDKGKTFRGHVPNGFACKKSFSFEDHQNEEGLVPKDWYYNEFEDSDGRRIEFSFAAWNKQERFNPGSYVRTYDLLFIVKGTLGKQPGAGGKGGRGGSGGRSGEFKTHSPNGHSSSFNEIAVQCESGKNGTRGNDGHFGKPAQNGNDIALIDRSDLAASKVYIGEDGKKKLTLRYFNDDREHTRFSGYRIHHQKLKDCFVGFEVAEVDILKAVETKEKLFAENQKEHSTKVKTPIVTEELMAEFQHIFEENLVPDEANELQNLNENIDEEEEIVIEERVSILRDQNWNAWSNDASRMIRQTNSSSAVDEDELLERINRADTATDEELAQLWTAIFSFDGSIPIERLGQILNDMEQSQRGKTEEWKKFLLDLRKKWNDKKMILEMPPISFNDKFGSPATCEDITVRPLSPKFLEWDKAETIEKVTLDLEAEALRYHCSTEVADVLRKFKESLKNDAAAFEPFRDDSLDWTDSAKVMEHLKAKSQEPEGTQLKKRGLGGMQAQQSTDPKEKIMNIARSHLHPVHQHFQRLEELRPVTKFRQPGVAEILTLHDRSNTGANDSGSVASNCDSIINVFFRSDPIVKFNKRLDLYKKQMKTGGGFATWNFETSKNVEIRTAELLSNLQNGIRSPAYLHLIADKEDVNIKVYRKITGTKVRLLSNINENGQEEHRILFDDDGNAFGMERNANIEHIRNMIWACKGNYLVSEGVVDFSKYVAPSDKEVVNMFSDAVVAASDDGWKFLSCIQRIFELFGFHMCALELIFAMNTYIDLVCNFHVNTDCLCVLYCKYYGRMSKLSLQLRLWAGTQLQCEETTVSEIEDGRVAAFLGSRIHELNQKEAVEGGVLKELIQFVEAFGSYTEELESSSLKDLMTFASNSWSAIFGELATEYEEAAYYITILRRLNSKCAKQVIGIIEKIRRAEHLVSLGVLALFTTLLQNGEYESFKITQGENEKNVLQLSIKQDTSGLLKKFLKYDMNEGNEEVRMQTLRKTKKWKSLFPETNRSREELRRLCVPISGIKTLFALISDSGDSDFSTTQIEMLALLDQIDGVLHQKKNIRLRDTQKITILSAYIHNENLLSQVTTGEGKTYIIVALSILYVKLSKKKVDVITSSPVLARRDALENKDIYSYFEMKVSHNCDEKVEQRKIAYKDDVVYGDVGSFQRDFLLDEYYKTNYRGSRQNECVIVDEVDSMLLDHGNHMLYLSHTIHGIEVLESLFVFIYKMIAETVDEMDSKGLGDRIKAAVLSDISGTVSINDIVALDIERGNASVAWETLKTKGIVDGQGVMCDYTKGQLDDAVENLGCSDDSKRRILAMITLVQKRQRKIEIPTYFREFVRNHLDVFVENAMKSTALGINDEYVVDFDRSGTSYFLHPIVTIIDKGTGTDLYSSQWSDGLHQFLQLDNGCRISPISCKAIFTSNVSYFMRYQKINGLSGTLGSNEESKCLRELYKAKIVRIPTWKPKMFAEEAPIIVKTNAERIERIYMSLKKKIDTSRSVLIICSSIAEVDATYSSLRSLCNEDGCSDQTTKAIACAKIYRRDYESFEIDKNGLECCSLIFSTNLAGRGTDIKLSDELEAAGGLHVIIGFSENRRIQEQAFGRAARCGSYGSGQIIAVHENNKAIDIFRLQQQRDFAESIRLQNLQTFYENNIKIQEWCLEQFAEHCKDLRTKMNSQGKENRIAEIVYSALCDEWALWLDGQSETIAKCRSDADDAIQQKLQNSLKQFLNNKDLSCFSAYDFDSLTSFSPPSWMRNPQLLIHFALALFEMDRAKEAVNLLLRVQKDVPELMGETCYYLGVIMQKCISDKKVFLWNNDVLTILWERWNMGLDQYVVLQKREREFKFGLKEDISTTVWNLLLMARASFSVKIENQERMLATMQSLLNDNGNSRGYRAQKRELIFTWLQYIKSIDIMLGGPMNDDKLMFADNIGKFTAQTRKPLTCAGVLSPFVLQDVVSLEYVKNIAKKHYLQPKMLIKLLQGVAESKSLPKFRGRNIIDVHSLSPLNMPNAIGFWDCLQKAGIFANERKFLAVKCGLGWEGTEELIRRGAFDIKLTDIGPSPVTYNKKSLQDRYKFYSIDNITEIENDSKKNAQLREWIDEGLAYLEIVGTIDPCRLSETQFLGKFDYITAAVLKTELGLLNIDADWIISKLTGAGTLAAVDLRNGRIGYRLKQRMNLNLFPENMREVLWNVFTRYFCYGYALKTLQATFQEGSILKNDSPSILLPIFPYKALFEDLISFGIVVENRVTETALLYMKLSDESLYSELVLNLPMMDSCTIDFKKPLEYMREQGISSKQMGVCASNAFGAIAVVHNKAIFEHHLLAIRKRFLCLFSVGLNVPNKFFTAIEAPIGTTNYYMEIIKRNQQVSYGFIAWFMIRLHKHVLKHAFITKNTAEVFEDGLVAACVRDCKLLPMLKHSIESFMLFYMNLTVVNFLRNADNGEDNGTFEYIGFEYIPVLNTIIVFAKAVVIDINKSKSSDLIDLSSMSLDEAESTPAAQQQILATENSKQLKHLLSQELHKLLAEICDNVINSKLLPMVANLLASWIESGFATYDKNLVSKRTPIRYSEKADEIAHRYPHQLRDIHNIFLKFTYQKQKPEVVAHMVRNNFPLGIHCIEILLSGIGTLLETLKSPFQHVHVVVSRNKKEILKALISQPTGHELRATLQLSLVNNCFFAGSRPSKLYGWNDKNNSLFAELKANIPEKYGREEVFLAKLANSICHPKSTYVVKKFDWFDNENLRCAVPL